MSTSENKFSCNECGKSFKWKNVLTSHLASHITDKPFKCSECGKGFSLKGNLVVHERSHTGEKWFSCDVCGKNYYQKVHLDAHMLKHTGEKPFSCSECGKCFNNKKALNDHTKVHKDANSFICFRCEASFTSLSTLKVHITDEHREDVNFLYGCTACRKHYLDKGALKRHIKFHKKDELYPCGECGQMFYDDVSLEEHITSHEEKKFSCPECGKKLPSRSKLRKHMIIHTDKRPYMCECGKGFCDQYSLRRHMQSHSGARPFSCPQCAKTYKQERNLKSHMKLHTLGKAHSCVECGKSFGIKHNMLRHMQQVHGKGNISDTEIFPLPSEVSQGDACVESLNPIHPSSSKINAISNENTLLDPLHDNWGSSDGDKSFDNSTTMEIYEEKNCFFIKEEITSDNECETEHTNEYFGSQNVNRNDSIAIKIENCSMENESDTICEDGLSCPINKFEKSDNDLMLLRNKNVSETEFDTNDTSSHQMNFEAVTVKDEKNV